MNFVDEIVNLLLSCEEDDYALDQIDIQMANYLNEYEDYDFITAKSEYSDFGEDLNLIDLCLDYRLQNTLCEIIRIFPELAEAQDEKGNTLLHRAMECFCEYVGLYALEVDVDFAKILNYEGKTYVHIAMANELEKVGLSALDADPTLADITDNANQTFVHIAVNNNMPKVAMKALSKRPESAEIQDNFGNTYVHNAALVGFVEIYRKARKVHPNSASIKNIFGLTYMECAKISKNDLKNDKNPTLTKIINNRIQEKTKSQA